MNDLNNNQKTDKQKKIIISIIAVVVIVILTFFILRYLDNKNHKTQDDNKTIETTQNKDENNANNTSKNDTKAVEDSNKLTIESDKKPIQNYEGSIDKNSITGVFNSKSVSNGILVIRVTFNQLLRTGACDLTLTNTAGKTVTKTANVIANPSSSSCMGFDIPVSELGNGEWNIQLKVKSGDLNGIFNEKVEI